MAKVKTGRVRLIVEMDGPCQLSRQDNINRKFNNIFFMFKKEAHGLALTHRAFVNFLALWAFLIGVFLSLWTFLAPTHMGQGQALWAEPN